MKWWLKIPLWLRVIGGLLLGVGAGVALRSAGEQGAYWAQDAVSWIKVAGDFFIAVIKMLVVPLVFLTMVSAVVSMGRLKKLRQIGFKAVFVLLITSFIAAAIGIGLALYFKPGAGMDPLAPPSSPMLGSAAPTVAEQLMGLVPENPVASLAQGDVLQIIVFAVLFGLGLIFAKEKGAITARAVEGAAEAMVKVTGGVMELAPFGVFALMTWVASTYGVEALQPLSTLILCLYLGCFLHAAIIYGGLVRIVCNLPILRFYGSLANVVAVAFSTASSNATIPVTLHAVERNLGVSNRVASFVVPLGATINKDGTALFMALATVFGAQAFNVPLDPAAYVIIILTATLAATGSAGIPGAGLIMMSVVLTSVNVPLEVIAIITGIDRIMDMARTTVNVIGDCSSSVVVAKWEKEIDEDIFRGKKRPMDEFVTDESPAAQPAV
jgi:Na+/H+-dicarboxylate symporter